MDKCTKFKELSTKDFHGDLRFTNNHNFKKFYERIPYFIFAFTSKMSLNSILKHINKIYLDTDIIQQVDGIFVLNRRLIINFGDGNGTYKHVYKNNKKLGFCIAHHNKEEVLGKLFR